MLSCLLGFEFQGAPRDFIPGTWKVRLPVPVEPPHVSTWSRVPVGFRMDATKDVMNSESERGVGLNPDNEQRRPQKAQLAARIMAFFSVVPRFFSLTSSTLPAVRVGNRRWHAVE